MSDGWAGYTELARELDGVRAAEVARSEGARAGLAEMTQHADMLQARAEAQNEALIGLSQFLRLRMPRAAPFEPPGPVEPHEDLAKAAHALDRVDTEATGAADRGQRPSLLPDWAAFHRAAAVYGAAAAVILLGQVIAFLRGGDQTSPILVLFLIPVLCFLAAYLTLRIGSQTRVKQAEPKTYSRFGAFTCFLVGPVVLLLIAVFSLATR